MNKHLFAIFTYFATFSVSVLLVGFLTPVKPYVATSCFPGKTVTKSFDRNPETVEQTEIRNLLEKDQSFGLTYFAGKETANNAEKLVEQMNGLLDNSKLPTPLLKAYKAHTEAWNNYAKHLGNSGNHDFSDRECRILNREINETYNTVLIAAENYGVDFKP